MKNNQDIEVDVVTENNLDSYLDLQLLRFDKYGKVIINCSINELFGGVFPLSF